MPDETAIRPTVLDDRTSLREKTNLAIRTVKHRLAEAAGNLGNANVFDHVLASLAEIAMGKTLQGEELKDVHPRTQAQAGAAFMRAVTSLVAMEIDVGPLPVIDTSAVPELHLHLHGNGADQEAGVISDAARSFLEARQEAEGS